MSRKAWGALSAAYITVSLPTVILTTTHMRSRLRHSRRRRHPVTHAVPGGGDTAGGGDHEARKSRLSNEIAHGLLHVVHITGYLFMGFSPARSVMEKQAPPWSLHDACSRRAPPCSSTSCTISVASLATLHLACLDARLTEPRRVSLSASLVHRTQEGILDRQVLYWSSASAT